MVHSAWQGISLSVLDKASRIDMEHPVQDQDCLRLFCCQLPKIIAHEINEDACH